MRRHFPPRATFSLAHTPIHTRIPGKLHAQSSSHRPYSRARAIVAVASSTVLSPPRNPSHTWQHHIGSHPKTHYFNLILKIVNQKTPHPTSVYKFSRSVFSALLISLHIHSSNSKLQKKKKKDIRKKNFSTSKFKLLFHLPSFFFALL